MLPSMNFPILPKQLYTLPHNKSSILEVMIKSTPRGGNLFAYTPLNIQNTPELTRLLPDTKPIKSNRDGRNVTLSLSKEQ